MNMDALASVTFGDKEALGEMLFENGLQHRLFRDALIDKGINSPGYPIIDADVDNLDDWLQMHQIEHQFYAGELGLNNPFNLLDADFRKEDDFYEWLNQHYTIHLQIAAALGL